MDIAQNPKPVFPGPKPPVPPLPSPKPVAPAPAPQQASVAIHTMKDDLAALRTASAVSSAKAGPSAPPPKPAPKPVSPVPPVAKAPPLPIAPLKPSNGKSVVIPHAAPTRRLRGVLVATTVILLLILGGASGAWYFFWRTPGPSELLTEEQKSIADMLPATTVAVTEYQLTPASRQRIPQLFSQPGAKEATVDTLLAGDPRLALEYPDVSNIYYVQLFGERRPYLVSPENPSWATVFASYNATQTTTQHGWRIAHAVNVNNFITALEQGTAREALLPLTSTDYGVRVYLAADTLKTAVNQGLGVPLAALDVKGVTLASDISITGGNLMLFNGIAETASSGPALPKAEPALLTLVPASSQFVYSGSDLGADIAAWSAESSLLAPEIISQPQVKQIMAGFAGLPYVFYRQSPAAGTTSFGLIVKLTAEAVTSLSADKTGLEAALFALRPLVTGTSAPLPTLPLFADGVYNDIPLRYVNVNGPAQAIDYAMVDPYLIIGTSKDGMFATLDVIAKKTTGLLEQNANLAPATASIQANSTATSILILPASESGILASALPGFAAADNAIITTLAAPLDGATQAISGLLAF